ncbi:MAG: cysteine dioxygenase family protein [Candidatus Eremiobacteraeota bacterium]|nr:cysteine dioxygenase family protein [Candidatus Eremiobacteraeota bacterium]
MARTLTRIAEAGGPFPELPRRPGAYTRTCAYQDDRFEVLLLDWSPGAASPIHDHGGQHCWFVVLRGRLWIDDYVRTDRADVPGRATLEPRGARMLDRGDLDLRSGRFDIHRLAATDAPALSLHVYSRPLESFSTYDPKAQRCTVARSTYDLVLPLFELPGAA